MRRIIRREARLAWKARIELGCPELLAEGAEMDEYEIWRPAVLRRSVPLVHRVSSVAWYAQPQREQQRLGDIDRARAIAAEPSDRRRRLLIDSVRLDVSAALSRWRELAGDPGAGRLQVRAVGFETASGSWGHTRDIDVERIFCNDVRILGGDLARTGVELVLERATPEGAQSLRTLHSKGETEVRGVVAEPHRGCRRQ